MEQAYNWIGFIVMYLSAFLGSAIAIAFIFKLILNVLGSKFYWMWIIIEYMYYRKDFKEWVSDKERHPFVKNKNTKAKVENKTSF